ncbi:MAG: UDP-N-acetylmuramoyl-tripeptide--D-alanyl-D-alanine ligase [Lachnospiraceae bacterium]|nr:UDP-N-acetylmuramoyl-tripeptide--D-alanyl-D-alanine ligase [Lachnospiraceae bacterium]
MKNLTLRHIAEACGGILHEKNNSGELEVQAIVTDSRQAGPGALFAAVKGERVDGHSFIPAVFAQGALCVLTEHDLEEPDQAGREMTARELAEPDQTGQESDRQKQPGSWIRVISTLQALKDIAEYYLMQLNIPVVGITGSVGKTSTKEMVASVLSQKYRTLKTQGNFNNELGLPLTVFRLREEDEIAVLEMGISDFGEMHRLAKIARPDTCIITNIGQCHLEFLGDRDGILRAKTEIFDFLKANGHIILNGDDDKLMTIQNVNGITPVYFGIYQKPSIYADEIESRGLKGISCRIHTPEGAFGALIPIPGVHMVYNALAGTAAGLTYGLTLEEIKAGIESLQPLSGRFHIIETSDYIVIDDCYNANPVSMKASLEVLQDGLGRKVAILGDMGELGENETALHEEVGSFAASCRIDKLISVGPLCGKLAEKAKEGNPSLEVTAYDTLDALLANLQNEIKKGDTILVKASHFMQFPKVVEALQTKNAVD